MKHCFGICGLGENAVDDTFFLEPYEVWCKTAEHLKLENMDQVCGTDNSERLVCTEDILTMLEPELIYSWLSQEIVDDAFSC